MNSTTNACSIAGACSPWWLPFVGDVSAGAALILPVVSIVWIATQMIPVWYRAIMKASNFMKERKNAN